MENLNTPKTSNSNELQPDAVLYGDDDTNDFKSFKEHMAEMKANLATESTHIDEETKAEYQTLNDQFQLELQPDLANIPLVLQGKNGSGFELNKINANDTPEIQHKKAALRLVARDIDASYKDNANITKDKVDNDTTKYWILENVCNSDKWDYNVENFAADIKKSLTDKSEYVNTDTVSYELKMCAEISNSLNKIEKALDFCTNKPNPETTQTPTSQAHPDAILS